MRRQVIKRRAAVFAAAGLVSASGAASLGFSPAGAAVPAAQSTTAFCVNVPDGYGGFTDIASSIHRKTIECLAAARIAQGKTATSFAPSEVVTRGVMASFIARAVDKANELERVDLPALPASPPDHFQDDDGTTHETNINRLAEAGIVSGTTATTFSPNATVTRAQMATFINNAQEFLSGGAPFTSTEDYFVDDETSVHEDNINGIAAFGITAGVDSTHYGPSLSVLRANMATFITRYLAVLHKFGVIDPLPAPVAVPPAPIARVASVSARTAVITIDNLVSGATAKVYLGADGASFAASTLHTSSATDARANLAGFQVNLSGLTPSTSYEYYATQTSGGEESPPAHTAAGPDTSLVTTAETPPSVVAAAINGGRPGTLLRLDFSEPVTPLPDAAPKVTVVCTDLIAGIIPTTTYEGAGISVAQFDVDTLTIGMNGTVPEGGTCKAAIGAGAAQDVDNQQNAAQSDINVP